MKKRYIRRILCAAFAGAFTACAVGLIVCGASASVSDAETEAPVLTEIYVGDEVTVPSRVLEIGGESRQAEVKILSPDGGAYSGKSFIADEAGIWTVEYWADFSGGRASETVVYNCVRRPIDLFAANSYARVESGSLSSDEELKGLSVTFRSGGAISFTPAADLKGLTKEDVFAELIVDASSVGNADFSTLTFTISDVYDPENILTIVLADAGPANCNGQGTYVRAAATGQALCGYNAGELLKTSGTHIKHSFRGLPENGLRTIRLYYDDGERALYASSAWDYRDPEKTLVADFDDETAFPDIQWKGFTTGEVNISVSASGFSAVSADVLLIGFCGYDLSAEKYIDSAAPVITVDYGGEETVPGASVGTIYPVFGATAFDDFEGQVPVDVRVYFESVSGTRTDVWLTDGKFRVDYVGEYVIEYTAKDKSGNSATESVRLISVSAAEPIKLDIPDLPASAEVYTKIQLPELSSVGATGGFGNISLKRRVIAPDGSETDAADLLVPDELGVYTIIYEALDYCGNTAYAEQKISSLGCEKPIFTKNIVLPEVLITGFTYELPDTEAKETSGNKLVTASVEKYVNGNKVSDGRFVASGESVSVKYAASGVSGKTEYMTVIPVVDGNGGKDQDKYFYGDFIVTENQTDIELKGTGSSSLVFANPLNGNEFLLEFYCDSLSTAFRAFSVSLRDAENPSVSVTLLVEYGATGVTVTQDGIKKYKFSANGNRYRISYANASRRIEDGFGSGAFAVETDDAGGIFGGFSGALWLEISAEGLKADSRLYLTRLNNQPLGYRKIDRESRKDEIAPQIVYEDTLAVKQTIGTSVKLPSGRAYDVLGEIRSFTVTVVDPEGKKVLDGVSASESRTLTFDKYGIYNVNYRAADSNGNVTERIKLFKVNEVEAPVLTVKADALKSRYSAGDIISIPEFSASDNSGACTVNVYLLMPDNQLRLLVREVNGEKTSYLSSEDETYPSSFKAGENAFRAESKGSYKLVFFAYDAYYNCTSAEWKFVVG